MSPSKPTVSTTVADQTLVDEATRLLSLTPAHYENGSGNSATTTTTTTTNNSATAGFVETETAISSGNDNSHISMNRTTTTTANANATTTTNLLLKLQRAVRSAVFHPSFSHHWLPGPLDSIEPVPNHNNNNKDEDEDDVHHDHDAAVARSRIRGHDSSDGESSGALQQQQQQHDRRRRSWRRRIFLVLTEPETSVASAVFFAVLVVTISLMNAVMILQTMQGWQFTPTDCRSCGGPTSYGFDDDDSIIISSNHNSRVACVCPPAPVRWTVVLLSGLVYFFTAEWILRLLTFDPPGVATSIAAVANNNSSSSSAQRWTFIWQWLGFLVSPGTVLDALAIFPYYIESLTSANGLMSLRLLRLFRVFQLVRLGQFNETFVSLTAVMYRSVPFLKLLLGVLLFGAAFFGSMIYWVEKGDWKFHKETNSYQFVRQNQYGAEEISPFTSIPSAFWWFAVTATTVGYGDTVPTSTLGKWIAAAAMLMGVLVIAFPVSVFSDLWSKELRKTGALTALLEEEEAEFEKHHEQKNEPARSNSDRGAGEPDSIPLSPDLQWNHPRREPSREIPSGLPPRDTRAAASWEDSLPDKDDNRTVVLRRDDLADLLAHVQSINESQRNIRAILRKYKLH